jgi:hypothetical protein
MNMSESERFFFVFFKVKCKFVIYVHVYSGRHSKFHIHVYSSDLILEDKLGR